MHERHGMSKTRLYNIWRDMRVRCSEKASARDLRRYYSRGIRVCDAWLENFSTFAEWANKNGYHDHLVIDRIENDGNYEPGNCRWVTHKRNSRNRRSNRMLEAFGETKCLKEWAEDSRCSVTWQNIQRRLNLGWSVEKAIVEPVIYERPTCKRGHEFTADNTILLNNGKWRSCRTCSNVKSRDYQRRKSASMREAI